MFTLDALVKKYRRHTINEYFRNLPAKVQMLIIAFLVAIFRYFGYDVVFTEQDTSLEQVEIVINE